AGVGVVDVSVDALAQIHDEPHAPAIRELPCALPALPLPHVTRASRRALVRPRSRAPRRRRVVDVAREARRARLSFGAGGARGATCDESVDPVGTRGCCAIAT